MSAHELTLEWVAKAEEDAAVAERECRVRKTPSPGAVCYHALEGVQGIEAVLAGGGDVAADAAEVHEGLGVAEGAGDLLAQLHHGRPRPPS